MSKTRIRIIGLLMAAAVPAGAMAEISFYAGIGGGGSRVERDDITLDFKVLTGPNTVPGETNPLAGANPPFSAGDGPPPFDADPFTRVSNPSGTDFAWKVFGGARYGDNLGIEAGYINLGRADAGFDYVIPAITRIPPPNSQPVRGEQDRQIDVETQIDGFQLYGVGFLPLGDRFELFGKIGLFFWDRKTEVLDRRLAEEVINQPFTPDNLLYTGGRNPDGSPAEPFALSGPDQNLFACLPATVILEGEQPIDPECAGLLPRRSDRGTDLALGFGLQIKASERVSLRSEFEWFDMKGSDSTWAATVSLVFGF